MTRHLSTHLRDFCQRGTAMSAQLEQAFTAQLEQGEDPERLEPARFATLATRAAVLVDTEINWSSQVIQARLLPPHFIENLAIKLAVGEIDPVRALAELTEREAEITCRIGGEFLAEVVRRMKTSSQPEG